MGMVTERLQAVTSDLAPPFAIVDLDPRPESIWVSRISKRHS
jgi:hypothetical protein